MNEQHIETQNQQAASPSSEVENPQSLLGKESQPSTSEWSKDSSQALAADPSPQASPEPRLAPFVDPPHADLLTADDWMHLHVDYDVQGPDRGYIGYIRKDNGQLLSIEDVVQLYGGYVENFVRESRVTAPVHQPRNLNLAELKQFWHSEGEVLSVAEMSKLIGLLLQENAEVKVKLSNEYRASIGEVWHWQADEFDHLESLTCPILISADAMRAALASPPQIAQPLVDAKRWMEINLEYDKSGRGYIRNDNGQLCSVQDVVAFYGEYLIRILGAAQPSQVSAEQLLETISAKVHEQWMDTKRSKGITTRKLESGEELMVPYKNLSEDAKELDRGSVRAVLTAQAALAATPPQPKREQSLTIRYTNYRGETADRSIAPARIYFGATKWHPEEQWLLEAFDFDRKATRTFALKDVRWKAEATPPLVGSQRWIPVQSDMPLMRERVLVRSGSQIAIAYRGEDELGQHWEVEKFDPKGDMIIWMPSEVTHWQPLPAPPEAEATQAAVEGQLSARELAVWILTNCAAKYVNPVGYSQSPQEVIDIQIHMAEVKIAEAYRAALASPPPVSVAPQSQPEPHFSAEWEFNEVVTEELEEVLSGDEFHAAVDRIMKAAEAYASSSRAMETK